MNDFLLVLVTVSSVAEGERIASKVVEDRLAACVNIVPNLRSFFRWDGKITEEGEALLLLKTTGDRLDALAQRVKRLHSYELPEVIALPIVGGLQAYLDWVHSETHQEDAT